MIHERSVIAIVVFLAFVGVTLGISFYFGRRTTTSQGYFAAHGQIPWFINGIAFAGDYLSAASFLGICGMIAFFGYDGFLYSIGYLAGWIVALFVVAEPLKRIGKFTFADALDAKFQSRGIKLAVGVSTLAVSLFYLIPQMVGAGSLIVPLLGFSNWFGVVLVGATVIVIVVTAGMVSTTYVQFLKGSLLVVFSSILTFIVLGRGLHVASGGSDGHQFLSIGPVGFDQLETLAQNEKRLEGFRLVPPTESWKSTPYVRWQHERTGEWLVMRREPMSDDLSILREAQIVTNQPQAGRLVAGLPLGTGEGERQLHPVGYVSHLPESVAGKKRLGLLEYLATLQQSEIVLWPKDQITEPDGTIHTIYYQAPTPGSRILLPGETPTFKGIRSPIWKDKLNFISLMLALFCGTASLPHILIRYYTVKDEGSARKSTIVGIASIGFFYVLTLYMGLGAMTSGALDVTDTNMAAPLLAKSISTWLFAAISAIAFTTVLGTVSGLILASAGAVTHDLLGGALGWQMTDHEKVRVAKVASVVVGGVAIGLGILFQGMNVTYLVGWAFSVAASANLPSLVMLLFWNGVTRQGVIAAVMVGMISSLAWILTSAETLSQIFKYSAADAASHAWVPFSQPGIVTIPLGFLTLIVVSLLTQKNKD